jgi:hypothetical protein
MKAIKFKVNRKGNGYVATALVPANHSESAGVSKLGVGIAGTLLLLTAGFLVFLGILFTQ